MMTSICVLLLALSTFGSAQTSDQRLVFHDYHETRQFRVVTDLLEKAAREPRHQPVAFEAARALATGPDFYLNGPDEGMRNGREALIIWLRERAQTYRDNYERIYGSEANQALLAWEPSQGYQALYAIFAKYPLTIAGEKALKKAAYLSADHGWLDLSMFYWRRIKKMGIAITAGDQRLVSYLEQHTGDKGNDKLNPIPQTGAILDIVWSAPLGKPIARRDGFASAWAHPYAEERVYVRDLDGLRAIETRDGSVAWTATNMHPIPIESSYGDQTEGLYLPPVFGDLTVGEDGVFFVEPGVREDYFTSSSLVHYDHSGLLLWRISQLTGFSEMLHFLGPPALLGRHVYVMVESEGRIHLLELAQRTGQLLRSLELTHGTDPYLIRNGRRKMSIRPYLAGDQLIAVTNVGVIAAVDLISFGVRWMLEDGRLGGGDAFKYHVSFEMMSVASSRRVVVDGNRVYLTTPYDPHLLAIDQERGLLLWSVKLPKGSFLIGRSACGLILQEQQHIRCLSERDGSPEWVTHGHRYEGHGVLAGEDAYLVPDSYGRLLQVNTKTGQLATIGQTEAIRGNLSASGDRLLVFGGHETASLTWKDAGLGLTIWRPGGEQQQLLQVTAELESLEGDPEGLFTEILQMTDHNQLLPLPDEPDCFVTPIGLLADAFHGRPVSERHDLLRSWRTRCSAFDPDHHCHRMLSYLGGVKAQSPDNLVDVAKRPLTVRTASRPSTAAEDAAFDETWKRLSSGRRFRVIKESSQYQLQFVDPAHAGKVEKNDLGSEDVFVIDGPDMAVLISNSELFLQKGAGALIRVPGHFDLYSGIYSVTELGDDHLLIYDGSSLRYVHIGTRLTLWVNRRARYVETGVARFHSSSDTVREVLKTLGNAEIHNVTWNDRTLRLSAAERYEFSRWTGVATSGAPLPALKDGFSWGGYRVRLDPDNQEVVLHDAFDEQQAKRFPIHETFASLISVSGDALVPGGEVAFFDPAGCLLVIAVAAGVHQNTGCLSDISLLAHGHGTAIVEKLGASYLYAKKTYGSGSVYENQAHFWSKHWRRLRDEHSDPHSLVGTRGFPRSDEPNWNQLDEDMLVVFTPGRTPRPAFLAHPLDGLGEEHQPSGTTPGIGMSEVGEMMDGHEMGLVSGKLAGFPLIVVGTHWLEHYSAKLGFLDPQTGELIAQADDIKGYYAVFSRVGARKWILWTGVEVVEIELVQ